MVSDMLSGSDLQGTIIKVCSTPVPLTMSGITRKIQELGGVSPYPQRARVDRRAKRIKRIVDSLVSDGVLVKITKGSEPWKIARELASRFLEIKPRNPGDMYQSHFLAYLSVRCAGRPPSFLPSINPIYNIGIIAMLEKILSKTRTNEKTISNFVNFMLLANEKSKKDEIRLFLYALPIDYSEIDTLEKLLDYGEQLDLPYSGDITSAKRFLTGLFKNTGSKGGPSKRQ